MSSTSVAEYLQLGDHICTFIDDAGDALDVMAQTVAADLTTGDKVMVFTGALASPAVLPGLEERGVATSVAQRTGQVQVLPAREAYLSARRFEAVRMLNDLDGHIEQASRGRYRGLRVVGDMSWALAEPTGVDQLASYEARVNHLFMDGRALAICLYDRCA